MSLKLFLDIETIPTQSDKAKARIASSIKPPAQMKKADTIAAWEKDQKAASVEDAIAKTSLNGAYGHVCCVGFAFDDEVAQTVSWPLQHKDEKEALKYLSSFLQTADRSPVIVGHNVAAFDIRFLWQRAMILGVRMPSWLPLDPKPWSIEVFDTMTAFAGTREFISLDALCDVMDVTGKGDVDGSMIGQMFADGRHEEIAEYCKQDVDRTRQIYRKMSIALGRSA